MRIPINFKFVLFAFDHYETLLQRALVCIMSAPTLSWLLSSVTIFANNKFLPNLEPCLSHLQRQLAIGKSSFCMPKAGSSSAAACPSRLQFHSISAHHGPEAVPEQRLINTVRLRSHPPAFFASETPPFYLHPLHPHDSHHSNNDALQLVDMTQPIFDGSGWLCPSLQALEVRRRESIWR